MNYILETERLILREFTLADAHLVLHLLNSSGWLEFIGDRNVKSEAQAIEYLKNEPLRSYRKYGYGSWLVEKREDGNRFCTPCRTMAGQLCQRIPQPA